MQHAQKKQSYALLMTFTAVFFIFSCKLRVEKLDPSSPTTPSAVIRQDTTFIFSPDIGTWHDSIFRFCCNGEIVTHNQLLAAGSYDILLTTKGTVAYEVYPLLKVWLNDKLLKEIQLDSNYNTYHVPFLLKKNDSVKVYLKFNQDGLDDKGHDRDVFIKKMEIKPRPDSSIRN